MANIWRFLVSPLLLAGVLAGAIGPAGADEGGPAALVEAVENAPDAGVGFLDYVYPGTVIELGNGGRVTLSYFDTCLTETITGGRVKVARGLSEVDGGRVETTKIPCAGGRLVVTAETSEAGATVSRVTPFAGQDWVEYTVNTPNPVFKWPAATGATTLRVVDMDADPPRLVWEGTAEGSHFAYPPDAPLLAVGPPYQVRAVPPGGEAIFAMFSIDPDLESPATVTARVVPLGR